MQERTPDEETTSRLALTALALAHAGARAQEILEAITTDCGNAGIALSHQQRGLIVTHALFSARNGKREGRRSPTTTPDAPPATPASDPPVVTSTTQARDSRDRSAGIPIVPDMPAVDEPPSGRTGTVQPLTNRRRPAHAPTEPFTPVPNRIYELAEEYRLSAAAQAVLHVLCRDIYGWHLQDRAVTISLSTLATRTNQSRQTVVTALDQLDQHTIIARERQTDKHGRQIATRIRLTIPERACPNIGQPPS